MPGLRNITDEPRSAGLPVARIAPNGHHIGQFDFSRFYCLPYHVAGHDLRQTGRVEFFIGIAFAEHLPAGIVHQDPCASVN